jgi:hypothetical protein
MWMPRLPRPSVGPGKAPPADSFPIIIDPARLHLKNTNEPERQGRYDEERGRVNNGNHMIFDYYGGTTLIHSHGTFDLHAIFQMDSCRRNNLQP